MPAAGDGQGRASAAAKSRAAAHNRAVESGDHWTPRLVACGSFMLVAGCLYGLFMVPDIPDSVENILFMLIGQIVGGWLTAVTFYQGASAGGGGR